FPGVTSPGSTSKEWYQFARCTCATASGSGVAMVGARGYTRSNDEDHAHRAPRGPDRRPEGPRRFTRLLLRVLPLTALRGGGHPRTVRPGQSLSLVPGNAPWPALPGAEGAGEADPGPAGRGVGRRGRRAAGISSLRSLGRPRAEREHRAAAV